jgi:hypothetical protein
MKQKPNITNREYANPLFLSFAGFRTNIHHPLTLRDQLNRSPFGLRNTSEASYFDFSRTRWSSVCGSCCVGAGSELASAAGLLELNSFSYIMFCSPNPTSAPASRPMGDAGHTLLPLELHVLSSSLSIDILFGEVVGASAGNN